MELSATEVTLPPELEGRSVADLLEELVAPPNEPSFVLANAPFTREDCITQETFIEEVGSAPGVVGQQTPQSFAQRIRMRGIIDRVAAQHPSLKEHENLLLAAAEDAWALAETASNLCTKEYHTSMHYTKRKCPWRKFWLLYLGVLQSFVGSYGRLPQGTETYKKLPIAAWVRFVSITTKSGRPALHFGDRETKKLNQIKGWRWTPQSKDEIWVRKCQLVAAYSVFFGFLPRRLFYTPEGFGLGSWAYRQRVNFRRGVIAPSWKMYMETAVLAWDWELKTIERDSRWDKMMKLLEEFVSLHKRVPRIGEIYKDNNVGAWFMKQIPCKSRLDASDIDRLRRVHHLGGIKFVVSPSVRKRLMENL